MNPVINEKLVAMRQALTEKTGEKMVYGKWRKLKTGLQKSGDASDRTMDKIDKVTDKVADLATKHGGKFGAVGVSLYHQTQAAKHLGQGLRNAAFGQDAKASKRFAQAGASMKTGIKTGLKAAAAFK